LLLCGVEKHAGGMFCGGSKLLSGIL
jgi:hypothetical protein